MGIFNYFRSLLRRREARRNGVPFRERMWYNYMAMLPKDMLSERSHIEIFDEDGRYINCPDVGGEVICNYYGRRYRYKVIGFRNDSRNRDWLYDTDYINPVVEYIGELTT